MIVQKALHLHQEMDKKRPKCLGEEYCLFEKYDGWYGYLDCGDPSNTIKSRAGRTIPSLEELSMELISSLQFLPEDSRLIFEIIIPNMEFAELNGILNRKYEQAENAFLICHDFVVKDRSLSFIDRYESLNDLLNIIHHDRVGVAPMIDMSSEPHMWRHHAEEVWAKGGEGLILKRALAPYGQAVRNYDLMKIKEELTLDLEVIGVEEGKGKYENTLGALIVVDKSNIIHTISGMDDSQRDQWWEDPRLIIGRVVEVKAMKKLPDGQLREPRFIAIRHDKLSNEID